MIESLIKNYLKLELNESIINFKKCIDNNQFLNIESLETHQNIIYVKL
jgi:hypothetical protein